MRPQLISRKWRAVCPTLTIVGVVSGSAHLKAQQIIPIDENTTADSAMSVVFPASSSVSPGGAFLRAILVPGWGHVSIGANTRAGAYFGIESSVAYGIIRTRRRISEVVSRANFRETQLRESLAAQGISDQNQIETALNSDATLTDLIELREARGDQQEDLIAFGLFLLLLSGADAYVSAHLKDFPDPLVIEGQTTGDGRFEIGLRIPIPN